MKKTKVCNKCYKTLPKERFYRIESTPHRRMATCIDCYVPYTPKASRPPKEKPDVREKKLEISEIPTPVAALFEKRLFWSHVFDNLPMGTNQGATHVSNQLKAIDNELYDWINAVSFKGREGIEESGEMINTEAMHLDVEPFEFGEDK